MKKILGKGKGKNFGIIMVIALAAVVAIGASMYMKNRSQTSRARFATGGYVIPASGPGTHQLTQATPPETSAILRGAAKVPDRDIVYTLNNIRPLDNSFTTGAYVGTLKSETHQESLHGENSYKNRDVNRNSIEATKISVPPPIKITRMSIAGSEYNGVSYLGGIGSPRGPQHAVIPTKGLVQYPVSSQATQYAHYPIAGAYRAGSKGFL